MFKGLIKQNWVKIGPKKKILLVIAISILGLVILNLGYGFLTKGSVALQLVAPSGSTEIIISDSEGDKFIPEGKNRRADAVYPEVYKSDKRAFKVKLKPGKYLITAKVDFQNDKSLGEGIEKSSKLSSEAMVEVSARSSKEVKLNIDPPPNLKSIEATGKTVDLGFNKGDLYSLSEYGQLRAYDLASGKEKWVARNESANLASLVGACHFSNGTTVAYRSDGKLYSTPKQGVAKELDIGSIINDDMRAKYSSIIENFAFNDPAFLCTDDSLQVYKYLKIDKELNLTLTNYPVDLENYARFTTNSAGQIFLYNSPDVRSADYSFREEKIQKSKVKVVNPDGEIKELDLGFVPTNITSSNKDKFCYSNGLKIGCRNIISNKDEFNKDTLDYVGLIEMVTENSLVYTSYGSVWLLDLVSGEKRNLFNSSDNWTVYALEYSAEDETLAFSVSSTLDNQKIARSAEEFANARLNQIYTVELSEL